MEPVVGASNRERRQDQDGEPGSISPTRPGAEDSFRPGDQLAERRLDHFRIGRKLGQGGMGAVYEGWDTSLDRRIAIKMLRDDIERGSRQEERFLREARAQAKMNHANVVHIYYIGRRPAGDGAGEGSLYFAMELIDGSSLEELVEQQARFEPEQARRAMLQVARGLEAACRAGIIHRDIKPSNLMRGSDGVIKVADFGLAKPVADDTQITQDGAMVGSPLYMAPEQARNADVDHRADMYSLGATFYQLLAGRPPFEGQTALAVIAQHLEERPPPLRQVAPQVPVAFAAIIDRLLAKKPEDRYETYEDLIAALEEAAPRRTSYAGFWTRGAAVILDTLLAGGLIALIGWPGVVIHLVYVTIGHAFWGQTLAKYFLKIRVQRKDGRRIGLWRSALRTMISLWAPVLAFATIGLYEGGAQALSTLEELSPQELDRVQDLVTAIAISNGFMTLLYFSGLAVAAFHRHKRALHDLVVGSVVVYRLPGPRGAPDERS